MNTRKNYVGEIDIDGEMERETRMREDLFLLGMICKGVKVAFYRPM